MTGRCFKESGAGRRARSRACAPLAAVALLLAVSACGREPALERAKREYEAGNYRDAVVIVKHHLKKDGEKTGELLYLAGRAWLKTGSEAEARSSFDECRRIDPSYSAKIALFLKNEAIESIEGEDFARGRRLMLLALEYQPGLDFGRHDLVAGRLFLDRRDYGTAAVYLERFVRAYPDEPGAAEAFLELAGAYEKSGMSGRAIEAYQQFHERYPKSRLAPDAGWELEGLLLREAEGLAAGGSPAEAESMLVDLAATATSPIVKERSNFLLGELCEARGDTRRAVRYYRAVIEAGSGGRLVEKSKERVEKLEMSKRRR